MNATGIFAIFTILGTASSLILGNLAAPVYSLLSHADQSQTNSDPATDKKVLKGVELILNGVNIILMGKTSGGLDQISIGANMIRSAGTNTTNQLGVEIGTGTNITDNCNFTKGESGGNGSPANGANGGEGGKGGIGGASCFYGGNGGIGGYGGNGGIGGNGGNGGIAGKGPNRGSANGGNGGSANGGNGGFGGNGGSVSGN